MAGTAARDRPVTGQIGGRVTVTTEAEVMKTRFGPEHKVWAAATMTTDA